MKTERAIELLNRISDSQFDGIHGDKRREALSMAVRALFSQQTVNDSQGLVNDCISRKMAIDAIEEMQMPIMRSKWESDQFKFSALAEVREMISELPSAQPERMRFVQQAVNTIMHIARSDSIKDKSFRNAARMIQNAIDGEPQDFEPIPDDPERKKGKWIKLDMHAHIADHKCTACGEECYVPTCMGEPMYTYCPNCGARMDGESDE